MRDIINGWLSCNIGLVIGSLMMYFILKDAGLTSENYAKLLHGGAITFGAFTLVFALFALRFKIREHFKQRSKS